MLFNPLPHHFVYSSPNPSSSSSSSTSLSSSKKGEEDVENVKRGWKDDQRRRRRRGQKEASSLISCVFLLLFLVKWYTPSHSKLPCYHHSTRQFFDLSVFSWISRILTFQAHPRRSVPPTQGSRVLQSPYSCSVAHRRGGAVGARHGSSTRACPASFARPPSRRPFSSCCRPSPDSSPYSFCSFSPSWKVSSKFSKTILQTSSSNFWNSLFPGVSGIGCFVCSSFDGENKGCEDPFNSTMDLSSRDRDASAVANYNYPCWAYKKGRHGLFPADHCIKIVGYRGEISLSENQLDCPFQLTTNRKLSWSGRALSTRALWRQTRRSCGYRTAEVSNTKVTSTKDVCNRVIRTAATLLRSVRSFFPSQSYSFSPFPFSLSTRSLPFPQLHLTHSPLCYGHHDHLLCKNRILTTQ